MASTALLQSVFDIGEEMMRALEADDMDRFVALVHQRGELLDRLRQMDRPAVPPAEWNALAESLSAQHLTLTGALSLHEDRMQAALRSLLRVRDAHRSYNAPPGTGSVLNNGLRG
jgi:hypothetical protein